MKQNIKIAKQLIKLAKKLIANNNLDKIKQIAQEVRQIIIKKYGIGDKLSGHCIQASDLILEKLKEAGISGKVIEGYVLLDDTMGWQYPYEQHTWVESCGCYIDVTAQQFNAHLSEQNKPFQPICIFNKYPDCVTIYKPEIDENGYLI